MIYKVRCRTCQTVLSACLQGTGHSVNEILDAFKAAGWRYVKMYEIERVGQCGKCREAYGIGPYRH